MTHCRYRLLVLVLALAGSASVLSTDLYTPALPRLSEYFAAGRGLIQMTISLHLVCFGLAHLLIGPLVDRHGSKPILLAGMAVFVLSCLACALAPAVGHLIAARMLQGASAAAEAVVSLVIIRTLFDRERQVRALAIYGLAVAATAAAAPVAGGAIVTWLDWQASFVFTALVAVVSIGLILRIVPQVPGTVAARPRRAAVVAAYQALLGDHDFVAYSVILGLGLGLIFVFVADGPFYLIGHAGLSAFEYGIVQALVVGAYFCGSLYTAARIDAGNEFRLLSMALAAMLAGSIALTIAAASGHQVVVTYALSWALIAFGAGPLLAISPARALAGTPGEYGSAAALLGTIQLCAAGLCVLLVTVLHEIATSLAQALVLVITTGILLLVNSTRLDATAAPVYSFAAREQHLREY